MLNYRVTGFQSVYQPLTNLETESNIPNEAWGNGILDPLRKSNYLVTTKVVYNSIIITMEGLK